MEAKLAFELITRKLKDEVPHLFGRSSRSNK